MKKVFTAEQISDWFTSGATFANVKITDPTLTSYEYPSLPITKNRQKLISLIENNSVVIIRGATGSGKTTQVPQYILDHYNKKSAPCNIVVTQPRKIGATSIARWVASERKCALGSLVGYQVGLKKMATEHTSLIYMTTGVLLQKLVRAKCLTEYTHIFVDEVHERTEEMDFLLLILRKLLHSNSRYVKIILMSATINCGQFAEYFSTSVRGKINPAYVFEVEGAPYTIDEFYLEDLQHLFPYRTKLPQPDDPFISVDMYNIAVSLIQSFDEVEGKDCRETSSERGSVLVFLPGLHEICYMQEALSKFVHKLQVYPLHSTVTLEEQNGVFLPPVPGYRKVILSTNIAESSVTVPDVKYIDFCLARHLVCDPDTNYQSLQLTWASKINSSQRKRAGRVSKGFCYRLVTRDFWKNEIPDYMIPEMLLAPLGTILLKVKLLDMGDPCSVLSTALSPPNHDDIVKTVLQLKEDGELTFLGRVLAHLPVDLYLGKMIVLGHVFGCLEECLIIASQSMKSFFAIPSMQQLAGHSKLSFARGTPSDSIAFVNAFKAWYSSKKKGQLRHPKDELDWGKENFIQIKRIREQVAELFEDLKTRVSQFNMHIPESSQPLDYTSTHQQKFILEVVIAGAYYPNYFVQGEVDEYLASREVRNLPPYSFLYYKQLQSLFRLCGLVKAISFDNSSVSVDFQTQSVSPIGLISGEIDPEKLPSNQMFVVNITEVVEVGHFWGFCADEASMEKQHHMTSEINRRPLQPLSVSLYSNLVCLAPYSEVNDQSMYYRAKVLHMRGNTVEVFFLDFGNTLVVPCSSLRELPLDLLSEPFQAQEFQIMGMRPSAQSIILGNPWSSRSRHRFATLVKGHSLIVSLYSILHGVMRVELLISTDTLQSSIRDILVKEGHAEKADESFESKRTVTIERTSMNSLAINENPHYKHQRMLVAGTVSVNSTTRILLKETTLMPDIPGLPVLITMLFTPVMELRTNEERTAYTGALCGLGWNSNTQEGVLPEHDIELAFDVKFDVEDITEINALRLAVNQLVCEGPSGTLHLGSDQTAQLQDDCRERLILFSKYPAREVTPPMYYSPKEKWNQVDPSLKMDIVQPESEKSRGVLFHLHPVTLLNT
uniref:ATP-dependent RNA helicase TDRD9 n=1 Tax=Periophthalmus magnuspinnatus TaxID=409849 RepID=A0A3B4A746_9GOBI